MLLQPTEATTARIITNPSPACMRNLSKKSQHEFKEALQHMFRNLELGVATPGAPLLQLFSTTETKQMLSANFAKNYSTLVPN